MANSTYILLVEDIAGDALLVKEMLRDAFVCEPFDLRWVKRVSDAVQMLVNAPACQLILLDLALPDSQGRDTFKTLQAHADGVPIIVLSGDTDESLALDAVACGAQDYLIKGQIDGDKLKRAIQYACKRKEAELRLLHQVNHDPLTGLPNRTLLVDRIQQALLTAERDGGVGALLFVDLDRFKHINDTYGHNAGDEVLRGVKDRLVDATRTSDTVARLGGDEFVVLVPVISCETDLSIIAERILANMAKPITIGGHEMEITASIGGAIFPQDGNTADLLLKKADQAMYTVKGKGSNGFKQYLAA